MSAPLPSGARLRRSAIYIPAASSRALEKASTLPCDTLILDLEDSAPAEAKPGARQAAAAAVAARTFGSREVVIRVNGLRTPWAADDLAAAAAARPDAILVPKILGPSDLALAREALPTDLPLWAMIETCSAVAGLQALGQASVDAGVTAWVVGAKDLAEELGCPMTVDRRGLQTILSLCVVVGRAHGLAVLDGIFPDLTDPGGLAAQAAEAAALGFDGKTAIHPTQLGTINRAFEARARSS